MTDDNEKELKTPQIFNVNERVKPRKRSSEHQLDLPKPPPDQFKVTSREAVKDFDQALMQGLRELGEKVIRGLPKNSIYLGSAAVHYVRNEFSTSGGTIVQNTNLDQVPEILALQGSKELGRRLALMYGHKVPTKLGEDKNFEG